MVSNEARNNIITLAVLAGFAIMISSFIYTFVNNMEKANDEVQSEVSKGVANVTSSQSKQTDTIVNLTASVNRLVNFFIEDREVTKQNLATFISLQKNQTQRIVDAIVDLGADSNKSREQQTAAFINTLKQSQNLTKQSLNVTEYRNELLENQTRQLDELIGLYNLTINSNGTLTMSSGELYRPDPAALKIL